MTTVQDFPSVKRRGGTAGEQTFSLNLSRPAVPGAPQRFRRRQTERIATLEQENAQLRAQLAERSPRPNDWPPSSASTRPPRWTAATATSATATSGGPLTPHGHLREHPGMTINDPPGDQPPKDDTALFTTALNHAWTWYDEYTKRAIQIVNFYIVATTILVTAYASAITGKHHGFAAALAITGLVLTALASTAALGELRAAGMAKLPLLKLQILLAGKIGIKEICMTELQHRGKERLAMVLTVFGAAAALNLSALVYAATN